MKIKLIVFLAAAAALILAFVPQRAASHDASVVMDFYNSLYSVYFASAENEYRKIDYANVKICDKYRAERILSKAKDDPSSPFSSFAENKFRSSVSYGNTLDLDEFTSLIRAMYGELCAFDPQGSTQIGADCKQRCEGDAVKSAESLICKGVGKNSVLSADGVRWYYSGNYVFSSENGRIGVVLRSPSGMTSAGPLSGFDYLTGRRFVSSSDVSSLASSGDGLFNEELLRLPSGSVYYVTRLGYSSPFLIGFSDSSKKADE